MNLDHRPQKSLHMINIHFETSLCIIDKTTSWDLPLDSGSSRGHAEPRCQTQDT
jgi:hypothetical protein